MHNIEAFGDKVRTEVGQIKINNRWTRGING